MILLLLSEKGRLLWQLAWGWTLSSQRPFFRQVNPLVDVAFDGKDDTFRCVARFLAMVPIIRLFGPQAIMMSKNEPLSDFAKLPSSV